MGNQQGPHYASHCKFHLVYWRNMSQRACGYWAHCMVIETNDLILATFQVLIMLCIIKIGNVFPKSDATLLFIFLYLYALSIMSFCFFMRYITKKVFSKWKHFAVWERGFILPNVDQNIIYLINIWRFRPSSWDFSLDSIFCSTSIQKYIISQINIETVLMMFGQMYANRQDIITVNRYVLGITSDTN